MIRKNIQLHIPALLFLLGMASVPAFAGSALGLVAEGMNATLDGQLLRRNTVVFSGQSLDVSERAVIVMKNGSRLMFGRETSASFLQNQNELTVRLGRGNLSMFHPDNGTALRVQAGNVSIFPAKGSKTVGEVAMTDQSLSVRTSEGSLRLEADGQTIEVPRGKAVWFVPRSQSRPQASGAPRLDNSKTTFVAVGGATGAALAVAVPRLAHTTGSCKKDDDEITSSPFKDKDEHCEKKGVEDEQDE